MTSIIVSEQILACLTEIANEYVSLLIPLRQTTALIMKDEVKLDRIDSKLMKEAEKLNKKESLAVKRQYREKQRVGAITYRSYSIQFKKDLIAEIRQKKEATGMDLSKLVRQKSIETGIHPKNITRWYRTKELKKKEGGRRALYPEMQIRLANFILNNPTMKRKLILNQAKQIMEDLQIPGRHEFSFSKGWYERFRDRVQKKKVTKGARIEDILKLEAKEEAFDTKKQEDYFFSDNDDFQDDEYSDEEEQIKIEQNLSYCERDEQDFQIRLSDHSAEENNDNVEVKQEQLFLESQQQANQVKEEEETSIDRLIKIQKENLNVGRAKRILS